MNQHAPTSYAIAGAAATALLVASVGLYTASVSWLETGKKAQRGGGGGSDNSNNNSENKHIIPSPRTTLIPHLSPEEASALPYPPNALPGGRDVATPYGVLKVFEWGPEDSPDRVLLLHGIGTPCLALGGLAAELVGAGGGGCRVMLFDFFGRGYSDAPADLPYDARLYASQVLLALASSPLRGWTGDDAFHLVGYSLGGGVSASFAAYWPRMVRSLTLVAGGGLIRRAHVGWRSRVLYSQGWLPERLLEALVGLRLRPKEGGGSRAQTTVEEGLVLDEVVASHPEGKKEGRSEEEEEQEKKREKKGSGAAVATAAPPHRNSDASGGDSFDSAALPAGPGGRTTSVASVMSWQLRHHAGFVRAFMSSIRHAPIYETWDDWQRLGAALAERRGGGAAGVAEEKPTPPGLAGGKILLVLGASDPVIVKEETIQDVGDALGPDGFETVVLDAGHEVAFVKAPEVARAAVQFWRRNDCWG